MLRFLKNLFTRRKQASPLRSERVETRSAPPPPPPTQGRSGPPPPTPQELRRKHRRLRLVPGGGEALQAPPPPEASAEPETSAADPSPEPQPSGGSPRIHLVFKDGSSTPVAPSSPGGVQIRYLAENLLPPEDEYSGF